VEALFTKLSEGGYRVIGIATKHRDRGTPLTRSDESGMTLVGLLGFYDPPKPGAKDAIADLAALGVQVRLITGDNPKAAASIAASVGIDAHEVMSGPDVAALDDTRLALRIRDVHVFAEVEPVHKSRIVQALRHAGESVGFLGDGINDAPALHAADVGLSVDSAVDVAKQASSIVLMEKGLGVVADGVRLGRSTFANTLKYIRLTTSANFGNMLSMAAASIFLPFLPLLPGQILLLNFLTDMPAMTIAADQVDPERVARPVEWSIRSIRTFMFAFGTLSTVFDLLTFALMIGVVHADAGLFQSSWFVMSALTELGVLFSLRTARPIWRSTPARTLVVSSAVIAALTVALPYIPWVAELLQLVPIPLWVLGALFLLLVLYIAANELLKRWFFARERAA
jgi:Mg2+-importing ATPase